MARIVISWILLLGTFQLWSQFSASQVSWTTHIEKLEDAQYLLVFEAAIDEEWYIFSQTSPEGGSQPAYFEFVTQEGYQRIGEVSESVPTPYYNPVFGVTEQIFKGSARFEQRIALLEPIPQIEITLYYQVCKEVCISAAEDFVFSFDSDQDFTTNSNTDSLIVRSAQSLRLPMTNTSLLNASTDAASSSLWSLVLLGLVGGIIALFTPCVLPLIPLTVSYFNQGQRSKRLAFIYGGAIVGLYLAVGLPFVIGNKADPQLFNEIASHPITNFILFGILTLFALSFITGFEINVPQRWVQLADQKSERSKGILSVFFMAFTLVLLSFSCTGPILGGILGTLATQSMSDAFAVNLFVVLGSFGVALAVPFVVFALFPKGLQRLPKSGRWMADLKFILGVAELLLAFKFLSNVDLVARWSVFKYEVVVVMWIVVSGAAAIYLIRAFIVQSEGRVFRSLAIFALSFFALVSARALKNPVSAGYLNTFAPPLYYALNATSESCPLGLECFQSFEEGWEHAQQNSKPMLLDFTGYSCVNCRRMESEVWSDPRIFELLNERFVIISLYVDNRETADESALGVYELPNGSIKSIRTQGQYWSLFQAMNFGTISQPYYVALSPELEVLNGAIQFSSRDQYLNWLETALSRLSESTASKVQ